MRAGILRCRWQKAIPVQDRELIHGLAPGRRGALPCRGDITQHDFHPEFGALRLLDPNPQDVATAVGQDGEREIHRLDFGLQLNAKCRRAVSVLNCGDASVDPRAGGSPSHLPTFHSFNLLFGEPEIGCDDPKDSRNDCESNGQRREICPEEHRRRDSRQAADTSRQFRHGSASHPTLNDSDLRRNDLSHRRGRHSTSSGCGWGMKVSRSLCMTAEQCCAFVPGLHPALYRSHGEQTKG